MPAAKTTAAPAKSTKKAAAASKPVEEVAPAVEEAAPVKGGKRNFKLVLDSIQPQVTDAGVESPVIDVEKLRSAKKDGQDFNSEYKGGRYQGNNPMQAAKKVFTRLRKASDSEDCKYIYTIKETTQGRPKTQRTYVAYTVRLETPKEVVKEGKKFTIYVDSIVRAYSVPAAEGEEVEAKPAKAPAKGGKRGPKAAKADAAKPAKAETAKTTKAAGKKAAEPKAKAAKAETKPAKAAEPKAKAAKSAKAKAAEPVADVEPAVDDAPAEPVKKTKAASKAPAKPRAAKKQ
mgnify:CR=1 FL=1